MHEARDDQRLLAAQFPRRRASTPSLAASALLPTIKELPEDADFIRSFEALARTQLY